MPQDAQFIRWSNVLYVMAIITAVVDAAVPFYILIYDLPLTFAKGNGQEHWSFTVMTLPLVARVIVFSILCSTNVAWLYGLLQVLRLARYYRQGIIFDKRNALCFLRLGVAFGIMGIVGTLAYPATNIYLYWQGISPWLADMPLLFILQPDYLMAGVFFFVLGKIMKRAGELEESDRLIV